MNQSQDRLPNTTWTCSHIHYNTLKTWVKWGMVAMMVTPQSSWESFSASTWSSSPKVPRKTFPFHSWQPVHCSVCRSTFCGWDRGDRRCWIRVNTRHNLKLIFHEQLSIVWCSGASSPKIHRKTFHFHSWQCVHVIFLWVGVVTGDGGYWCNSRHTYPTSKLSSKDFSGSNALSATNPRKTFPFHSWQPVQCVSTFCG